MLTDGERLIVVMLAEVMEALKLSHEVDPTLVKRLAINRDDWAIRRKYSGIYSGEDPDADTVTETGDILWMWRIIEGAIENLQGGEKAEAEGWLWNKFDGFDGNNDDHYGVAQTMIDDLGEYAHFKGRNLNSHSQSSLPRYRTMFAKFNGYVNAGQASPLSIDALRDICS